MAGAAVVGGAVVGGFVVGGTVVGDTVDGGAVVGGVVVRGTVVEGSAARGAVVGGAVVVDGDACRVTVGAPAGAGPAEVTLDPAGTPAVTGLTGGVATVVSTMPATSASGKGASGAVPSVASPPSDVTARRWSDTQARPRAVTAAADGALELSACHRVLLWRRLQLLSATSG